MMTLKSKTFLLVAVAFLALSAWTPAKTWTVNHAGGGADFTTFAAALAGIGDGDTIQFTDASPVTYDEGATPLDWAAMNVPMHFSVTAAHTNTVTLKVWNLASATAGRVYSFSDITFIPATNATYGDNFTTNGGALTFTGCTFDAAVGFNADRAFTLNGGTLTLTNCTVENFVGGYSWPILVDYGAVLNVTGTTFQNIQCSSIGGFSGKPSVTLANCTFTNTPQISGYPAIMMNPGTLNVTNSTFKVNDGNKGTFFGVRDDDHATAADRLVAKFVKCKMTAPATGADAPLITSASAPDTSSWSGIDGTFENCIFDGSDASFWGQSWDATMKANFKITNCLLLQKFAGWGAAIYGYVDGDHPNCFDTFEVKNCIIDGVNEGIHLPTPDLLLTTSDYNLLNKLGYNYTNIGAHSIDDSASPVDIGFVNAAAGDYHLQPTSLACGHGLLGLVTTDLDGNPRPLPSYATKCDLGPYEVAEAIKIWTINKTASADFSTYQAALTNASLKSGDFIQFTDASAVVYDISAAAIDWNAGAGVPTDITVTALHKGMVTIHGRQTMDSSTHRLVEFDNLNFTGPGGSDTAFYLNNVYATFNDCVFDDGSAADGDQEIQSLAGSITATRCVFKNMTGGSSAAILGDWGNIPITLTDCTFDNLQTSAVRVGGATGGQVHLTRVSSTNCSTAGGVADWAVISMACGTLDATSCTLAATSGLVFAVSNYTGNLLGATTLAATFNSCTLTNPPDVEKVVLLGQSPVAVTANLNNCIVSGGWVQFEFESLPAAPSTVNCNHCLFLNSSGAVDFHGDSNAGTGYGSFNVVNSIIDASGKGLNAMDHLALNSDYNLVNVAGSGGIGGNSLDGTVTPIDPMYLDAAHGDYHIALASPCAGKGSLTALTVDMDGNPRPLPANARHTDIGPYEVNERLINAVGKSWSLY